MEQPADLRSRRLFGGGGRAVGDLAASPFRADRDRIVGSPFFARLNGVTQVVSPGGSGLLVHNRLTHSLKVAQIGRAVAERLRADAGRQRPAGRLGGCDPDVVEAAALAHDLGHPPFGHLGEQVLDRLARQRLGLPDGFEGNAQSYRIVTSTEIRGSGDDRAGPDRGGPGGDAEVPVDPPRPTRTRTRGTSTRRPAAPAPPPDDPASGSVKFGAYRTELGDLRQARAPFAGLIPTWQQTVEASIMDTADDIAYAIHDVEDFYRVGVLQQGAVAAEVTAWQREGGQLRYGHRRGAGR